MHGSHDYRRSAGESRRVDAAIARLRRPVANAASARLPTNPVYSVNLATADEFYAHSGMSNTGQSPSTPSMPPLTAIGSTVPVSHGQSGLAGSRWANSPATEPGNMTPSQVHSVGSALTPSSLATLLGGNNNEPQVTLRSVEGAKIYSGPFQGTIGTVRLVTTPDRQFADLQILVNKEIVLNEALHESDKFSDNSGTLTFQAYSRGGKSKKWKMVFPLPYQSVGFVNIAKEKSRMASQTSGLAAAFPVASPAMAQVSLDAPVLTSTTDNTVASQPDSSTVPPADKGQLLIDFDAEDDEEPDDVSPSTQMLMGLITDKESIANLLNRLNDEHEGSFLDKLVKESGASIHDEYSSSLQSAAKVLVHDFYAQSDVFCKLPAEIAEPLMVEISQKVLELALSLRRTENEAYSDATRTTRSRATYSPDSLKSLRSRASTIEKKLIPEYENAIPMKLGARSTRTGSVYGESRSVPSDRGDAVQALLDQPPPGNIWKLPGQTTDSAPVKTGTTGVYVTQLSSFLSEPLASLPTIIDEAESHDSKVASEVKSESCLTKRDSHPLTYLDGKSTASPPAFRDNEDDTQNAGSVTEKVTASVKTEDSSLSTSDQDIKSESSDSELSSKLRALTLTKTPYHRVRHEDVFRVPQYATGQPLNLGSDLMVKEENVPSSMPQSKKEHAEVPVSPNKTNIAGVAQPVSILEVNNGDLKGNPGLAASRWAQPTKDSSNSSELRRTLSSRRQQAPTTPKLSLMSYQQHEIHSSLQTILPSTHHSRISQGHQAPYHFSHSAMLPQQPLVCQQAVVPQVIPQLATVLVTDPLTGQVTEITGIAKVAQPLVAFPGGGVPYGSPSVLSPVSEFPPHPNVMFSPGTKKSGHSTSLSPSAESFSPKEDSRLPLSPTKHENVQLQKNAFSTTSPFL